MKKTLRSLTFSILTFAMAFLFAACTGPAPRGGNNAERANTVPDDNIIVSISARNIAKPIITSIFTADPSAHVWPTDPNRLYLYPSQDVFPANGCDLMDRYHVFSTDNMIDWIDHGEILRRDDLPTGTWGPHYRNAYFMWAPDAAYNPAKPGGKGPYFFYFPHATGGAGDNIPSDEQWGNSWKIGVAWSDSPHKGFKGSEAVMLRDKDGNVISGTGQLIDPCIFQDGSDYYLVTGGSQRFRIAKLAADMLSLAEDFRIYTQRQLPHYHEGPWMFARENDSGDKIYYLMYPGGLGNRGDDMLYATSDKPYGPWNYQGSILDPVGTGDTSHGSVAQFNGKWYLFYHNAALSRGAGNLRSVCVDELFFNPDGTIQKVIQTPTSVTQNGPALNAAALNAKFGAGNWTLENKYSPPGAAKEEDYDSYTKLDRKYNAAGANVSIGGGASLDGQTIHNMHISGAYVEFTAVEGGAGGRVLFRLDYARGDDSDGLLHIAVGTRRSYRLNCPPTGGWGIFKDAQCLIDLQPGTNTIKLSAAAVNVRAVSIFRED
jgi:hypothetical protein